MSKDKYACTNAYIEIAENVLRRHRIRAECFTQNEPPRSPKIIDKIIEDIRAEKAAL